MVTQTLNPETTRGPCPVCGADMVYQMRQMGAYWVCKKCDTELPAQAPFMATAPVTGHSEDASEKIVALKKEWINLETAYRNGDESVVNFAVALILRAVDLGVMSAVDLSKSGSGLPDQSDQEPHQYAAGTMINSIEKQEDDSYRYAAKQKPNPAPGSSVHLIRPSKPAWRIFDPKDEVKYAQGIPYGKSLVQKKLDGIRIIIQKKGDEVKFHSEDELFDKTARLPVQAAELKKIKGDFLIDSEAVYYVGDDPGYRTLMAGYLNKKVDATDEEADAVKMYVFDVMYSGGRWLSDVPLEDRLTALSKFPNSEHIVIMTGKNLNGKVVDPDGISGAIDEVSDMEASEGAMIKDMQGIYPYQSPEAGRATAQNKGHTKYKREREVDVVVLGKFPVRGQEGVWTYVAGAGPISKEDAGKIAEGQEIPTVSGDTGLKVDRRGEEGRIAVPPAAKRGRFYYDVLGKTFNSSLDAKLGDIIRVNVGQVLSSEHDDVTSYSIFLPRVMSAVPEKSVPDKIAVVARLARESLPKGVVTEVKKADQREPLVSEFVEMFLQQQGLRRKETTMSVHGQPVATHRWVRVEGGQHAPIPKKIITTPHLWQRAKLRVNYSVVNRAIDDISGSTLPEGEWWHKVSHNGILAGHGNVISTVLSAGMTPHGKRVPA